MVGALGHTNIWCVLCSWLHYLVHPDFTAQLGSKVPPNNDRYDYLYISHINNI